MTSHTLLSTIYLLTLYTLASHETHKPLTLFEHSVCIFGGLGFHSPSLTTLTQKRKNTRRAREAKEREREREITYVDSKQLEFIRATMSEFLFPSTHQVEVTSM